MIGGRNQFLIGTEISGVPELLGQLLLGEQQLFFPVIRQVPQGAGKALVVEQVIEGSQHLFVLQRQKVLPALGVAQGGVHHGEGIGVGQGQDHLPACRLSGRQNRGVQLFRRKVLRLLHQPVQGIEQPLLHGLFRDGKQEFAHINNAGEKQVRPAACHDLHPQLSQLFLPFFLFVR